MFISKRCDLMCRWDWLNNSSALPLLRALWWSYKSLMRFSAFKRSFSARSLNSVSCFPVSTIPLSVFLSSYLSVSPCFSAVEMEFFLPLQQPLHLCGHRHHHPLILHLFAPSSYVRQFKLCFCNENISMNQSLVPARDTFSCFTLGALW